MKSTRDITISPEEQPLQGLGAAVPLQAIHKSRTKVRRVHPANGFSHTIQHKPAAGHFQHVKILFMLSTLTLHCAQLPASYSTNPFLPVPAPAPKANGHAPSWPAAWAPR